MIDGTDEVVAIVGSRAHPRLELVAEFVATLSEGVVVVSGGAGGVDRAAIVAAHARRMRTIEFPAQSPASCLAQINGEPGHEQVFVDGRDRLLFRNTLIAVACTRMVLFPDGSKGGCWDAAREAVRFHRPVEVRWVGGHVEEYLGGYHRRRKSASPQLDFGKEPRR